MKPNEFTIDEINLMRYALKELASRRRELGIETNNKSWTLAAETAEGLEERMGKLAGGPIKFLFIKK